MAFKLIPVSRFILGAGVFLMSLSCFYSPVLAESGKSSWTGEITGMAQGKMALSITHMDGNQNYQKVKGKLELQVESAAGYSGEVKGRLKGEIKNGEFKGTFSGWAEEVSCYGVFIGTLSETSGAGTWTIDARDESAGRFTGDWTLKKE